ncbi:hypothetical protein PR048_002290 [Dryococelus australis]|uniref:Uncharacterized protein n=1 Tax=Dryococelus australis TaxID=614101 RepID=A0ABQ9IJS0_9NEOP|nr:hypothetical protein PR048_002290 [Dryococelus australis]
MNAHSTGRIILWALKILKYTFDIKYTSGKRLSSLSRNTAYLGSEKDEDMALELPVFSLPVFDIVKAQRGDSSLVPLSKEVETLSKVKTKFSRLATNFCLKDGILCKLNNKPEVNAMTTLQWDDIKVLRKPQIKLRGGITGVGFSNMSRLTLEHVLTVNLKRTDESKTSRFIAAHPFRRTFRQNSYTP